jgi:hypothetical protein
MPAVVPDFDAGEGKAAFAEGAWPTAENLDENGPLLAWLDVCEQADRAVAVAMREAPEDVADGMDARFGGCSRQLRADALKGLDGYVESAWTRPVERGPEQVGATQLAGAREGAHGRSYWAASSHHQLGCPPS